jgi:hypothetical protein
MTDLAAPATRDGSGRCHLWHRPLTSSFPGRNSLFPRTFLPATPAVSPTLYRLEKKIAFSFGILLTYSYLCQRIRKSTDIYLLNLSAELGPRTRK